MGFILNLIHSLVAKGMKYLKAVIPHYLKEKKKKNIKIFYEQQISSIILLVFCCILNNPLEQENGIMGVSLSCLNQSMRLTGMIEFHPWYTTREAGEVNSAFLAPMLWVLKNEEEEDVGYTGQGMVMVLLWYPAIPLEVYPALYCTCVQINVFKGICMSGNCR